MGNEDLINRVEARFFFEYATFFGIWRTYVADTLYGRYLNEPDLERHVEFMEIGVFREFYASLEDLGAFLSAFLKWRTGQITTPMEELLAYTPRDIVLSSLYKTFGISGKDDLFQKLAVSHWAPQGWDTAFPEINVLTTLKRICDYFSNECTEFQDELGVRAYNKIKHGLVVVPNGSEYNPSAKPQPAALVFTPGRPRGESITVVALLGSPLGAFRASDLIAQIQYYLRFLVALYLCHRHSDFLTEKGFKNWTEFFQHDSFHGLISFFRGKPPISHVR